MERAIPLALSTSRPTSVTTHVSSRNTHRGRRADFSQRSTVLRSGGASSEVWLQRTCTNGRRTTAVWLDNTASVEVPGVPISTVWSMWQDKSQIPTWMPWITSVTVQPNDTKMSKWTLSTYQFGQQLEFSWMARDLTPVENKKIHWVSNGGLPNRGAVRFLDQAERGSAVQLTISYELPTVLTPIGQGVKPVVEGILLADLKRFAKLAAEKHQRGQ